MLSAKSAFAAKLSAKRLPRGHADLTDAVPRVQFSREDVRSSWQSILCRERHPPHTPSLAVGARTWHVITYAERSEFAESVVAQALGEVRVRLTANVVVADGCSFAESLEAWLTANVSFTESPTFGSRQKFMELLPFVQECGDTSQSAQPAPRYGRALRQDNPADTFLPGIGMKLRISYATRSGDRFVSWKGPGDPSPGSFSYRMDPACTKQQRCLSGTSAPWTGCMVTTTDFKVNPGGVSCTYVQVVSTDGDIYVTFSLSDGATYVLTRYVITYTGMLELQNWNVSSSMHLGRRRQGNLYGFCVPSAYCDVTDDAAAVQVPRREWSNRNFSRGCRRKEALRCGGGSGGAGYFTALCGMKGGVRAQLLVRGYLKSPDPGHERRKAPRRVHRGDRWQASPPTKHALASGDKVGKADGPTYSPIP
ncbi:hypothetical protein HU200_033994 [Digitaria exilis]|uniref:Uncharacterized protein n=1 Tax=Digitaria exilis TaxID=1010633 RepID=A0A835BL30_9POAL|nr:hypothetical protein HU200_033994 [Digitaria exilis]